MRVWNSLTASAQHKGEKGNAAHPQPPNSPTPHLHPPPSHNKESPLSSLVQPHSRSGERAPALTHRDVVDLCFLHQLPVGVQVQVLLLVVAVGRCQVGHQRPAGTDRHQPAAAPLHPSPLNIPGKTTNTKSTRVVVLLPL